MSPDRFLYLLDRLDEANALRGPEAVAARLAVWTPLASAVREFIAREQGHEQATRTLREKQRAFSRALKCITTGWMPVAPTPEQITAYYRAANELRTALNVYENLSLPIVARPVLRLEE